MSDFKLPGGSTLDVTLGRKRRKAPRPAAATPDDKGIIPVEADPVRYVRREQPLVKLFDLACRLRSVLAPSPSTFVLPLGTHEAPARDDSRVNEYVELAYQAELKAILKHVGGVNSFDLAASSELVDPARWGELAAALLGTHADDEDPFDPFASTPANVTGRRLPNVLQLPFDNSMRVTLGFGSTSYSLDEGGAEGWRQSGRGREGEQWNEQNVEDGTVFAEGVLKPAGVRGVTAVSVAAPFYYESFSTGSSVKVTAEPSFDAEAVAFEARLPLRIFLIPQLFAVRRVFRNASHDFTATFTDPPATAAASGAGTAMNGWSATRLPVFPLLKPVATWGDSFQSVAYLGGLTPLEMDEQPEEAFLRALNVALDRVTVQKKNVLVANVSGHATPSDYGQVSNSPYSLADVSALVDEAVEEVYAALGAGVTLDAAFDGGPRDAVGFVEQLSRVPAGQLVGVVEGAGGARFYFWRAAALDRLGSSFPIRYVECLTE